MDEKSRRDRVGLGLIGLGPSWEQVYREPLFRLRNRLKIRLVYDPVEARAQSVANDLESEVALSLRQMVSRGTLQGLLILDPGWHRAGALDLVAQSGKAVFLGAAVLSRIAACDFCESIVRPDNNGHAFQHNDQFMPEFGLRFTPSSCRLRELIATKLGPVRHLEMTCDPAAEIHETAALIDWCCDIMGSHPQQWMISHDGTSEEPSIAFEFPPPPLSGSQPATGKRTAKFLQRTNDRQVAQIDVHCQRGRATIVNRTRIVWESEGGSTEESLTEERTEVEILIDQFCRRALGGLNPVGRLSEHARGARSRQIDSKQIEVSVDGPD